MTLKSNKQLLHLVIVYFYAQIDCVHKRCLVNFMKSNFSKISYLFYEEDERSEFSVQTQKFLYIVNRLL
jgi:hypothetical protein